jgi:hypothetical protein
MSDRKRKREITLEEVLEGVDVVGTMLDLELPRLRAEIRQIRARLDRLRPPAAADQARADTDDLACALTEIRELLETQDRRIAALDLRLSRLAAELAEPSGASSKEDS